MGIEGNWRMACGLAAAMCAYHAAFEFTTLLGMLMTVLITAAIAAFAAFLSARGTFALFLTASLVVVVAVVSRLKSQFMNFALHAYDIVVYAGSPATLRFAASHFPAYLAAVVGMVAALAALAIRIYRQDGLRVDRRQALGSFALISSVVGLAYSASGSKTFYYFSNQAPLSVFYDSVPAAIGAMRRGIIFDAAVESNDPPFQGEFDCEKPAHPPHIILVHEESMFPPEYFPSLGASKDLDASFRSFDGKLHKLRVEIYGGGSWLSEFSLIAGIPSKSFGTMRSFVGPLMKGKVHDALPQVLQRCGYHSALFYPMDKEFVGDGPFFESVGVEEIFDKTAQGASGFIERDRFYFRNTLDYLKRQLDASGHLPQFVYVQTMAGHYPYDWSISPKQAVPSGRAGLSSEITEYLRRQWFAMADFDDLKRELKKRFPHERFLLVRYGDHQPRITRAFPEISEEAAANGGHINMQKLYMTYYAIEGLNYEPPPLPEVEALDISYLGAVALQAARIPMPPSYRERLRMIKLCEGRYYDCRLRRMILSFHRRLLDSGLIHAN